MTFPDVLLSALAILALVVLNAYFVAVEFAAVAARESRVAELPGLRLRRHAALHIKKRLELYLSSCQLGNTLASLALGAVTQPVLVRLIHPIVAVTGLTITQESALAFTLSFLVAVSLHMILGERAPKTLAIRRPEGMLLSLAVPLVIFTAVCYPIIWLLTATSNAVLRLAGVTSPQRGGPAHSEQELRALIHQAVAQGTLAAGHGPLVASAFALGDMKVRQIMTPRDQVDYLRRGQPIGDVLRTVQKTAFTRLPLCDGDLDHVVGLVHMKDLFAHLKLVPGKLKFIDEKTPEGEPIAIAAGLPGSTVHVIGSGEINLDQVKRQVLFVPELTPVPKLLRQFQASRIHLAVVVDEYGVTQGIVSLEDVLEEIVGEIEDEFDAAPKLDLIVDEHGIRVSGSLSLHDLRLRLPRAATTSDQVNTVGGYITQTLGRWPKVGDVAELGIYSARVVSVNQNRIGQVLLTPPPEDSAVADAVKNT